MADKKKITDPDEKLSVARAIARIKWPYLTSGIYAFIPYPVEGLGTMGVSKGLVLIYDPAWILCLEDDWVAFLLAHEVMHVIRQHAKRRGNCNPKIFNEGGDLGINPDLIEADGKMPGVGTDGHDHTGLLPEQFNFPKGLSAEEYYGLLLHRQPPPPPKVPGGKGKKGQGQGQGAGASGGGGDEEEDEHGQGHCGAGRCGGIAGNPINEELEAKVDAETGRTEAAVKGVEQQIAEDVKRHVAQKGRGKVPGSLVDWAKSEKKRSRIPWQRKIGALLRRMSGRIQSGGMDFSLARPSKNSYLRGILRPGLVQQEPEVAIILDTSGSMGHEQLKVGLRESMGVMLALGIDQVWWLEADAAVANIPKKISVRQLANIQLHGGGGTDFGPGIHACEKLKPRPDLIIYFTDGDGGAPSEPPPGIQVIWCIVPSYYNKRPARWGEAIIMRKDGDEAEYPELSADEDSDVVDEDDAT